MTGDKSTPAAHIQQQSGIFRHHPHGRRAQQTQVGNREAVALFSKIIKLLGILGIMPCIVETLRRGRLLTKERRNTVAHLFGGLA